MGRNFSSPRTTGNRVGFRGDDGLSFVPTVGALDHDALVEAD
jgi:hypothetical protein